MPESSELCRKCRAGFCQVGDSWCRLCSSAAALNEIAKHRFSFDSHRCLGEELIVQATRQLKSLVDLDKQTNSQVASLTDRLRNAQDQLKGTAFPKRSASRPLERPVKRERSPSRPKEQARARDPQEAHESDYTWDYEDEEEEDLEHDPPVKRHSGQERPAEPVRPPRGRNAEEKDRGGHHQGSRRIRGGRKHKRQYRELHRHEGQRQHRRHSHHA